MFVRTKLLILFCCLGMAANAQTGTSGDVDVITVGGNITLRRVNYYSEPMPDTSYITSRRAEIIKQMAGLNAELAELDTLKTQWETAKGAGGVSIGMPIEAVPATPPVPALMFSQGRGQNLWHFTASDRLGRNLLRVELRDDGTIWANGEQWVYSKTKKRYQLKKK